MNIFVGEVRSIQEADGGRRGSVDVRGARLEVALDFVPAARVGDSVLVHAGVALSVLSEDTSSEQEAPCV
jgi:hydrogenase expression/formation protein HypC